MRSMALILSLLMIGVLLWVLLGTDKISILVNGEAIPSPFDAVMGLWGIVVATIVVFCVAILMVFVFAGIGLLILGIIVFVGVVLFSVLFPFLLPVLIPLFLIWLFVVMLRKKERP